jgi:hypothetical protein
VKIGIPRRTAVLIPYSLKVNRRLRRLTRWAGAATRDSQIRSHIEKLLYKQGRGAAAASRGIHQNISRRVVLRIAQPKLHSTVKLLMIPNVVGPEFRVVGGYGIQAPSAPAYRIGWDSSSVAIARGNSTSSADS